MKILALTSDWKWTGPAEPMLLLALALREGGDRVWLGCPAAPAGSEGVADEARRRGLAPELTFERARGIRPWRDRADAQRLRSFIEANDIEIVHVWHSRDHALALRAAKARRRSGRTRVVRSLESVEALPNTPWNRWLFGSGSDGLLCVSPRAAENNAGIRGGRPIAGALGCVDVERFAGASAADAELCMRIGLQPGAPVIGVVARVQGHRRFDLLLDAMARLSKTRPDAQLLILGRGTRLEEVARVPAQQLGLEKQVVFAGHHGRDYAQILRAIEVLTFLVPGSDGTCRAVLEAAACGIPAVVTRRGALPEIVEDGVSGLLVDESPQALALSWERLLSDEKERARLGAGAAERARKAFAPPQRAEIVLALYREVQSRA